MESSLNCGKFKYNSKCCNVTWYTWSNIFLNCSLGLWRHYKHCNLFLFMLWHKEENMGVTQFSQDHLATCKQLGGAIILNLEIHLMAHWFALLWDMRQQDQPWISIYWAWRVGAWKNKDSSIMVVVAQPCILLKIQPFVCGQQLARWWHICFMFFWAKAHSV